MGVVVSGLSQYKSISIRVSHTVYSICIVEKVGGELIKWQAEVEVG